MKYITIEKDEDFSRAKIRLKSNLGSLSFFYALERPQTLMGSSKILTLRSRKTNEVEVKIDGPGFIIEELYKDFI
jgi:hypothetical protein